MSKQYSAADHVRSHLVEAADEGAVFIRKLLRSEIEASDTNLQLAAVARGAINGF